jgi:hypothetical protein
MGASSNLAGEATSLGGIGLGEGAASNLGGSGGTSSTGGTTAGGTTNTGGSLASELCGDKGCACSNGIDDDGDGLIDGFDPECTGPFDNDEGSFATGIPGDNRDPKWQDCFFDGNSGAGDDGCRYHTDCLTGDLPQDDKDCTVTQQCLDFCAPRTPNGCDCFGCCTVELPSGDTVDILTGSDCSLSDVNNQDACPPCEKSTQCNNECGTCELCPGKTVEDLPAECDQGGMGGGSASDPPAYTCDNGEQVCGPGLDPCGLGYYCALGCCLRSEPR